MFWFWNVGPFEVYCYSNMNRDKIQSCSSAVLPKCSLARWLVVQQHKKSFCVGCKLKHNCLTAITQLIKIKTVPTVVVSSAPANWEDKNHFHFFRFVNYIKKCSFSWFYIRVYFLSLGLQRLII